MITIINRPVMTEEKMSYVQDDRSWWDHVFGGEKAKREKVRILTIAGRMVMSDLILRSDKFLQFGVKFDYLDGEVMYRGVMPVEAFANSIYRCRVDSMVERN